MSARYSPADREEAWKRIGQTRDGEIAIQTLYQALVDLTARGLDDGALRENEGRRRFARELIELMNSGTTDERTGDNGRFLGPRAEPVDIGGPRGVRRRVPIRDPGSDG